MTLDVLLIAVGALGVLVAALSARIRRLPLSEPLLALVVGVLLGPEVFGALPLPPITAEQGVVHDATRVLLVISVIGVALRYPFGSVRSQLRPVVILLLVALPAMALISTGLTAGILGVALGAALMLGTAICPTDPVLASSVVTGKPAEEDLPSRDRQILSLESGANDGLALPFVLAAVALAGPMTAGKPWPRRCGRCWARSPSGCSPVGSAVAPCGPASSMGRRPTARCCCSPSCSPCSC